MSVFNMMFAGSGGDSIKMATPATASTSALSFRTDSEPMEYILIFVPTVNASASGSAMVAFISDTANYDRFYTFVNQFGSLYYSNQAMSYVTTSYSTGGVFTVTVSSSIATFWNSSSYYILLYR